MLLAIETSCDETAAAVFDWQAVESRAPLSKGLVSEVVSSQVKDHAPYGGVVPELAARKHLELLPLVVSSALKDAGIKESELKAIACSRAPGLKICLLVGYSFGKGLALSLGVPFVGTHHIEGHLYAHELEEGGDEAEYPRLSLIVSGGHTLLVLSESFRDYRIIAETMDDAAGEAFDKSASVLGLPYPGGPQLSALAKLGNRQAVPLPIGVKDRPDKFSFSGLKTAVVRAADAAKEGSAKLSETSLHDLAASTETAIVEALVFKSKAAIEKYQPKSFVLAGGVAANGFLRERLQEVLDIPFFVARHKWCTDNAAMIALVAAKELREGEGVSASKDPGVASRESLEMLNSSALSTSA